MKVNKSFIKKLSIGVLVVILLALGVLCYLNWQAIVTSLTPHPDTFTELYFQNNENILSKPIKIGNYDPVPYIFSFTIHNEEGSDRAYTYNVDISGYANETIDRKTIFLTNNQARTITETIILPNKIPTRSKVTVVLLDKNQQIFFWTGGTQ